MDTLQDTCASTTLLAHGQAVGLPDGLMGNSEVGHLNIGAGRVVYQDIVRIDEAVARGTLGNTAAWKASVAHARQRRLHLVGLVSDGGVHSHIRHLFALLKMAKDAGIPDTFVHFIADGRDTSPTSSPEYLRQLQHFLQSLAYGKIATVVGRYYAMDRDKRWERTLVAYEALVGGVGEQTDDPLATIERRLGQGETDEFLQPIIVDRAGCIKDGDAVVAFNFRSDRMRQLCEVFGGVQPPDVQALCRPHLVTMTEYRPDFGFPVLSPPQTMANVLAEWLSKCSQPQCHVAETEKIAHVTFFFNGGQNTKYRLEEHVLIPSPKVATYDLQPEMSVREVGRAVEAALRSEAAFSFVMCNLAPPDMVGHTGKFAATVAAVEATDQVIGDIWRCCEETGAVLFVTADHGNAEKMVGDNGGPHTAHTCAPVPFICTKRSLKFEPPPHRPAALCDVAPTILSAMGLPIPPEMTGCSLYNPI